MGSLKLGNLDTNYVAVDWSIKIPNSIVSALRKYNELPVTKSISKAPVLVTILTLTNPVHHYNKFLEDQL